MRKFQTAKLVYNREINKLGIMYPMYILAESLEDAIDYCKEYRPELVVCEEIPNYQEYLQVGRYIYNFNYN